MPRHSTRSRSAPVRDVPVADELTANQRERRQRLIDTAATMMVDVDYADIAVKDIAARADLALGTLYRYFVSKDHLMAVALWSWSGNFGRGAVPSSSMSMTEQVEAVFLSAAKAFERQPRVFAALMQLQATTDTHAKACFAEFADRQVAGYAEALAVLPDDRRDEIRDVMISVLSEALRNCELGFVTRPEVRRRVSRAAELVTGAAAPV